MPNFERMGPLLAPVDGVSGGGGAATRRRRVDRRSLPAIQEGKPATVADALRRLESSLPARVDQLVQLATADALAQLPERHDGAAEMKIFTAIEKRLRPHI